MLITLIIEQITIKMGSMMLPSTASLNMTILTFLQFSEGISEVQEVRSVNTSKNESFSANCLQCREACTNSARANRINFVTARATFIL